MEKTLNNSNLTMRRFWIDRIDYNFIPSFDPSNKREIDLSPKFDRKLRKVDESKAIVSIGFKAGDDNSPFKMDIVISGLFELDKWEENDSKKFLMKENTCAILFPYLRQSITTITSTANVPPLVLPIFNTFNLFNVKKGK